MLKSEWNGHEFNFIEIARKEETLLLKGACSRDPLWYAYVDSPF
jgi:hypothetical protein